LRTAARAGGSRADPTIFASIPAPGRCGHDPSSPSLVRGVSPFLALTPTRSPSGMPWPSASSSSVHGEEAVHVGLAQDEEPRVLLGDGRVTAEILSATMEPPRAGMDQIADCGAIRVVRLRLGRRPRVPTPQRTAAAVIVTDGCLATAMALAAAGQGRRADPDQPASATLLVSD